MFRSANEKISTPPKPPQRLNHRLQMCALTHTHTTDVPAFAYKVHTGNLALQQCITDKSPARTVKSLALWSCVPNGHVSRKVASVGISLSTLRPGSRRRLDRSRQHDQYPEMMFNFAGLDEAKEGRSDYWDRCVAQIKAGNMTQCSKSGIRMSGGHLPLPQPIPQLHGSNDYDNFLRTDALGVWPVRQVCRAARCA